MTSHDVTIASRLFLALFLSNHVATADAVIMGSKSKSKKKKALVDSSHSAMSTQVVASELVTESRFSSMDDNPVCHG